MENEDRTAAAAALSDGDHSIDILSNGDHNPARSRNVTETQSGRNYHF